MTQVESIAVQKAGNCSCIACISAVLAVISRGRSSCNSNEGLNGSPEVGITETSCTQAMKDGTASGKQHYELSPAKEDEAINQALEGDNSVAVKLMERVVERTNLRAALNQVRRNKGGPGIDGMSVDQLAAYLKVHWPRIRAELLTGTYRAAAVKRVLIQKLGGGVRELGVPTVVDRFVQQAVLQVLQADWDCTFSDASFGCRPKRSAHQAILRAQEYLREGYRWVVDLDLEKFFDTVNHEVLLHRVKQRVNDDRVIRLIRQFLKSGVRIAGVHQPTHRGTPQGGPLSPLLANVLLDELDRELERRGHRFVRYADDCNIYVRSARAGERVKQSVTKFLEKRLKLKVNELKSAVDRPWRRRILGFTFTRGKDYRRCVSEKAIDALKAKVRRLTQRTRGYSLVQIIDELRQTLLGWPMNAPGDIGIPAIRGGQKAYFGIAEAPA